MKYDIKTGFLQWLRLLVSRLIAYIEGLSNFGQSRNLIIVGLYAYQAELMAFNKLKPQLDKLISCSYKLTKNTLNSIS